MINNRCLFLFLVVLLAIEAKGYQNPGVRLINNDKERRVDVLINDRPFTSYIYPGTLKKPVLFPLRTSAGTIISRGFPLDSRPGERVDHPHHVGMWFNYGDVNGLDFWNNSDSIEADRRKEMGTIIHQKVNKAQSGKDKGILEVTANWVNAEGKVLLVEETQFIFSYDKNARIIDRTTKLTASNEPVLFKDNKEGVLGIRVARQLEHPSDKPEIFTDASGRATNVASLNNDGVTGKYISSEGKEGDAVWGTRGKWVTLAGKINNEPIALTIIDHPLNPGYPTYWHARGYGLFAANPLGQKVLSNGKEELNYKLEKGKSATFKYRVVITSGESRDLSKDFSEFSSR